ncbi:transcription antitermination factor NusB [Helicobacter bilis]|uniref:Transcription antitermination protein NusB n=1 Tax=Helicobacter bilis TaxID=37372 RepID=A0A4U8U8M3_9HELI|nr:transcription antitermination factor NusB [Helicobacter bilis]MCI7411815.1 transcription antitermination factor NusB [Helicobacter bilis]MDD7296098.1 transcription antitermination factor NusB [Helicobacter bilis]MDY4399985.1 transcription antitermination factor NusB [Helicobacter bilis]TLE09929.1 transcription antitermination factor NusB [Helicobacter bilis]
MATRKQAREAIIQILYAKELGNDKAIEQAEAFLNAQKIRNKQQEFALNLLHGICNEERKIADIINVFLKSWDLGRLGVIEKNIIKLGVYELLQTNTQKAVIINEAIELTKSFNVQDAFRLVNGILDSVAKTDPKTLDELIQKQEQINAEKLTQDSIKQTHIESKKPIKHNIDSTHSTKRQRVKQAIQKEIKQDSTQIPAKKTDMTHVKSIQISASKKDKEAQDLNIESKHERMSKKASHVSQSKDSKRVKDSKSKLESRGHKDTKPLKDARLKLESKHDKTNDSKNNLESKTTQAIKSAKQTSQKKDSKQAKDSKNILESTMKLESKIHKDSKTKQEAIQTKDFQKKSDSKQIKDSKKAKVSKTNLDSKNNKEKDSKTTKTSKKKNTKKD